MREDGAEKRPACVVSTLSMEPIASIISHVVPHSSPCQGVPVYHRLLDPSQEPTNVWVRFTHKG